MPKLSMFVLPMTMAPAARKRATAVASYEGTCPAGGTRCQLCLLPAAFFKPL